MLYPYILDKHPNQQPGANLGFRDLFNLAYPFLACRRLAAEAEARAQAEAEDKTARQREAVQQVVQLMKRAGSEISSTHNEAYDNLYWHCIHIIPELAEVLPKPKLSPEPMPDVPLQRKSHSHHVPPTPLPSACTALPPMTDFVASMLDVPVEPPPMPATAPVLSDVAPLTTSPLSPPMPSQPRGPQCMLTNTTSLTSAVPMPVRPCLVPPSSVQSRLCLVLPPPAQSCQILASPPPAPSHPSSVSPPSQVCQVLPPLPVQSQQVSVSPPSPPICQVSLLLPALKCLSLVSTPSARSTVSPRSPPGLPAPATDQMSLFTCPKSLLLTSPLLPPSSLPLPMPPLSPMRQAHELSLPLPLSITAATLPSPPAYTEANPNNRCKVGERAGLGTTHLRTT